MGIHCLLPFLRKLKSVCGPAQLLSFLRDKFVVWRQLKRFRKNRNCSLGQESIHLAAVTLTANELFNRESTLDMQTHYKETATFLYTNYFSCYALKGVNTGFAKGEALRLLRPNSSRSTFNKKHTDFQICLKE